MILLSAAIAGVLTAAAAAAEMPAVVVEAADSPVKIGRATVLTVAGDPPVLLYAATNQTENDLEQFTVIVFIFDAKGTLKLSKSRLDGGRSKQKARSIPRSFSTAARSILPARSSSASTRRSG